MTLDEFIVCREESYSKWICMIFQHYFGAFLCLFTVLGLFEPRFGQALGCLGALSELGWEWQDFTERFYRRLLTKRGKILEPNTILTLVIMHHTLGLLIIPMNLYYYD